MKDAIYVQKNERNEDIKYVQDMHNYWRDTSVSNQSLKARCVSPVLESGFEH